MQSINWKQMYAYGRSKDLIRKKEEIKRYNIIKQWNMINFSDVTKKH